ncbi:MAG: hypothetical protein ABIR70_19020 [Bryobacteraceae bacterium]
MLARRLVCLAACVVTLALPSGAQTLIGEQIRFEAAAPTASSVYVSTVVTVVDPGVEISCASPGSSGPGCGININQGGYSVDFTANHILFKTNASFGVNFGVAPCNCLIFTLLNPKLHFIGASMASTNIAGFPAGNVTFTRSAVTVNLSGLPAPANGNSDIAVQVATDAAMTVFPTSLSLSGFSDGPSDQKFVEVGRGATGQPFTATLSTTTPWLKVFGTGPAPQQIAARVDPTGLSAGRYSSSITINAPGATPSVITIPVTFDVAAASPAVLVVNPLSATLSVDPITRRATTYLALTNGGSGDLGPLTLTTVNGQEFQLQLAFPNGCPTRDAINRPITCIVKVTSTTSGVTPGTLNGSIIVKNSLGVVLKEIPVTQQVAAGAIRIVPDRYFVGAFADPTVGPPLTRIPQIKDLTLVNLGSGLVDFTAYTSVPWLTVTPTTGPIGSRGGVTANANAAGLRPGGYYGQVVARNIRASGPISSDEVSQVVMEVVPSTSAVRNTLNFPVEILIAKTKDSVRISDIYGSVIRDLVERPFTANAVSQGGQPFFTVSPSAGTISIASRPNFVVTLSNPAPPPGVYVGEVVVQVPNCPVGNCTRYLPVVAVVPSFSASAEPSRQAAATCVPTRIVPVVGSPLKGFEALTAWPTELDVTVVDDCAGFDQTSVVYATFSNGDAPVFLTADDPGHFRGTWTGQTPSGNVGVTFTAISTDGTLTATTSVGGSLTANPTPVPFLADGGILNGASFAIGRPLSPGSFVTLFGTGLADSQIKAPSVPLPLTLAGASVQIGGVDAPVFFASDGQLNAIVPYGLPVNTSLPVTAKRGDAVSVLRSVPLAAAAPGIFAYGNQLGIVVGVDANGAQTLADSTNPVRAGQVVVVYATGLGEVDNAVKAGSPTPSTPLSRTVSPVTVTIGGVAATVSFAGLTPGSTGLYQVNAAVPSGVAAGNRVAIVLKAAGQESSPAYISVR